jgi:hypothetical protein
MRFTTMPLISALLLAIAASADAALIRTLDGKSYTGEISFDSPGVISVTAANVKTNIPLTDLLQANFRIRSAAQLPPPWQADEVGDVSPGSTASFAAGVFALRSAASPDSAQFVHRLLQGDGEISARIIDEQNARPQSRAALAFRTDTTPDSSFVMLAIAPAGSVNLIYRAQRGAAVQSTPATKLVLPCWLKLTRQARRFVGYKSADGRNWEPLDPAVAADLSPECQIGLTLSSSDKALPVAAHFDNVSIAGAAPSRAASAVLSQGIVLRDGTSLPATIQSADEASITFDGPERKSAVLPTAQVARLLFAPVPARQFPTNHTGVLLTNGDFFDGQFKHFTDNSIRVSSILFGIKSFAPGTQAAAVLLADLNKPTAPFVIHLADASILPCENLQVSKDHLTVTNTSLDTLTLSPRQIDRIDRSGAAFDSLCDLPAAVNKPGVFAIDSTLVGLPPELEGIQSDRALTLASGAELTYTLDGRYRSLIATLGVPTGLLPYAPARFILVADGQEIFRSPPLTSIDDPLRIAVSLVGKSKLTLHLESTSPHGQGLLADPLLVRQNAKP